MRLNYLLAIALICILSTTVFAGTSTASGSESIFSYRRLGFNVNILGEPVPSLFGLNLTYRITDFAKISIGTESPVPAFSYGAGIRFFITPIKIRMGSSVWNPLVGYGISRFVGSWGDCAEGSTCESIPTTLQYLNLGFEGTLNAETALAIGALPLVGDSANKPTRLLHVYPYLGIDVTFSKL